MSAVDASIVLLSRFTTLVGVDTFHTLPLDVSRYGGAQFQVWSAQGMKIRFSESLDTENWTLGPSTPTTFTINPNEVKFFGYTFLLRWFRLEIVVESAAPLVTCWAEGLLRGGGAGAWPEPRTSSGPVVDLRGGAVHPPPLQAGAGGGAGLWPPRNYQGALEGLVGGTPLPRAPLMLPGGPGA